MKRGKPLRRRAPIVRNGRLANGAPANSRKPLRQRNPERRARLLVEQFGAQAQHCRDSPCCACGAPPPSDPAHVRSRGAGGKDSDTVPLCRSCHDEQHRSGIASFCEERGIDLAEHAAQLARELEQA